MIIPVTADRFQAVSRNCIVLNFSNSSGVRALILRASAALIISGNCFSIPFKIGCVNIMLLSDILPALNASTGIVCPSGVFTFRTAIGTPRRLKPSIAPLISLTVEYSPRIMRCISASWISLMPPPMERCKACIADSCKAE